MHLAKPSRVRSIRGSNREHTLKEDVPKTLIKGENVIFIPTKRELKELGGLDDKSKDTSVVTSTLSHPAYLCSEALSQLDALTTAISRYKSQMAIQTSTRLVMSSEEEKNFVDQGELYRQKYEDSKRQFFLYYEEMLQFWGDVLAEKYGAKWKQIMLDHAPSKEKLDESFDFELATFDIMPRQGHFDESKVTHSLFGELAQLSSKFLSKGDYTATEIGRYATAIVPKFERYSFLDPRVGPICDIAANAIDSAKASIKRHKSLNESDLDDFVDTLRFLSDPSALNSVKTNLNVRPKQKGFEVETVNIAPAPSVSNTTESKIPVHKPHPVNDATSTNAWNKLCQNLNLNL